MSPPQFIYKMIQSESSLFIYELCSRGLLWESSSILTSRIPLSTVNTLLLPCLRDPYRYEVVGGSSSTTRHLTLLRYKRDPFTLTPVYLLFSCLSHRTKVIIVGKPCNYHLPTSTHKDLRELLSTKLFIEYDK